MSTLQRKVFALRFAGLTFRKIDKKLGHKNGNGTCAYLAYCRAMAYLNDPKATAYAGQ